MKIFNKISIVIAVSCALGLIGPAAAFAATTPSLGTAATYGVLTGTFNYNLGVSTITGVAGSPVLGVTSAVPGSGGTLMLTGTQVGAGDTYTTAGTDQGLALSSLNTQANAVSCTILPDGTPLEGISIGGGTAGHFPPGCYTRTGALDITASAVVILDGPGTYIFRSSGGAITTGGASTVIFNPAMTAGSACDVFWTATGRTTLGGASTFLGTVIDNAGITIGAETTWLGRALAYAATLGNVTADNTNRITVPTCAAPATATLRVIKIVDNTNGGTATSSNFTVHVKLGADDVSNSPLAGTTTPGTSYTLAVGTYTVSEDNYSPYVQSFSDVCVGGSVNLTVGQDKTCTITNTYPAPTPTPTPPPAPSSSSSSGGSTTYGCKDPNALNYNYFSASNPALCVYANTIVSPVVATTTPIAITRVYIPRLPNTGFPPEGRSIPWSIVILAGALMLVSTSLVVVLRKSTI